MAAALAAGCAAAKTSASSKSTTSTTVRPTTTTFANDDAKAAAGLVTLSDLPAGWTAAAGGVTQNDGTPTDADAANNTALAACVHLDGTALNSYTSEEDSPTFSSPGGNDTVDDGVQVFSSATVAAQAFAISASPRAPACLNSAANGSFRSSLQQQLQAGQTLVSLRFVAQPIPRLADGSVDLQATAVVAVHGVQAKVFSDIVQVLKGRSVTTLSVTQPAIISLPQLGAQLAAVAAARMTP